MHTQSSRWGRGGEPGLGGQPQGCLGVRKAKLLPQSGSDFLTTCCLVLYKLWHAAPTPDLD